MAMSFQPPKGTCDLLPDKMILRGIIVDGIRRVFENYGYEPMETPAFESCPLLEIKCGEDIREQIYKFKDKGGRDLGLRYDLTVPLARVVASNPQLPKPFKRYCISRVWRYEKPTATRRREFFQCDVDIVGSPDPISDAEVVAVAADCLEALGLSNFLVRLNNRKILEGMLEYVGVSGDRALDVFRAIDKLAKIGREGVKGELRKIGVAPPASSKLLDLICKEGEPKGVLDYAKGLLKGITAAEGGCRELELVVSHLKRFGLPEERLRVDLSLARGIDYYTGPIFEVIMEGDEDVGSVAGGGRYDTLIELCGGRATPATGISLGVDRIAEIIERRRSLPVPRIIAKVFVAPADDSMRSEAVAIVQELRRGNIASDIDLAKRRLAAQLEYASKRGFPYAVIVGKRELQQGSVLLRDMTARTQRIVKRDKLVEVLRGLVTPKG